MLNKSQLRYIARVTKQRDQLLSAATKALPILKEFIEATGSCDHSVGICCCEPISACDALEAAIEKCTGEKPQLLPKTPGEFSTPK